MSIGAWLIALFLLGLMSMGLTFLVPESLRENLKNEVTQ